MKNYEILNVLIEVMAMEQAMSGKSLREIFKNIHKEANMAGYIMTPADNATIIMAYNNNKGGK